MRKDLALSLWWAACELVRAQDTVRETAAVGRITRSDSDRLHDANERWDYTRYQARHNVAVSR